MKMFYSALIVICSLALSSMPAYSFRLESIPSEQLVPTRTINADGGGVTVTYTFPGAVVTEDDLYPGTFRLSIPGFGNNMNVTEASWPVRWDTFEIPEGCSAQVEILSSTETVENISLSPAREDIPNDGIVIYSRDNVPPVAPYSGKIPELSVTEDDIQIYRDRRILYVKVAPISFDYHNKTTTVLESLSYRINYIRDTDTPLRISSHKRHDVDTEFMSKFLTYTQESQDGINGMTKVSIGGNTSTETCWMRGDDYLILSVPAYRSAVERFKEWKKKMGFNVTVVYASDWTPNKIKRTVKNHYDELNNLQYLLLLGDEVDLPGMRKTTRVNRTCYTDLYYTCMDGDNDITPDICGGRLPVSSLSEANTVVNKIISYESNPPTLESFYNTGVHCAEFSDNEVFDGYEDRRFTRTCEDVRNGMLKLGKTIERVYTVNPQNAIPTHWNKGLYAYGEELSNELKNYNWNGSTTDIKNRINKGVFYVLHRDHGAVTEWINPKFTISDVKSLSNGNLTPVVFSMNCLTGTYQHYDADSIPKQRTECFAEAFIRKTNGGCVGIIAASRQSLSGYNDALSMEIFSTLFPKSSVRVKFPNYNPDVPSDVGWATTRIGEVLMVANECLGAYYGGTAQHLKYTKEIFHCFGDPSMRMYTDVPVEPYVKSISLGSPFQPNGTIYNFSTFVEVSKIDQSGNVEHAITPSLHLGEKTENCKIYAFGENMIPIEVLTSTGDVNVDSRIKSIAQSSDFIDVSYEVPEYSKNRMISVHSVERTECQTHTCSECKGIARINVSSLTPGIYVVELSIDGCPVDTQKIIIK